MKLLDKTVLVTGASRGIGYAMAQAFHRAGAKVAVTGRHRDTLFASAERIGPNCVPFVCDHSENDSIQEMALRVIGEVGSPDILINNAGCMQSKPVLELSLEMWNRVLATNLTGVFLTTQVFLLGMIEKKRGDIIMISSMSGKKGDAGSAAYSASKFGLQGFSQALMHEVRRHNIRVMVMNPSRVDTSLNPEKDYGPGVTLHARDLAETALHLVTLPGRTMIRDMDIWGTNPF